MALRHRQIRGCTVAVLGYTFKRGTDDQRDSLAPKLVRVIEREVPAEIRICEPYVDGPLESPFGGGRTERNWSLGEALAGADVVFIATNHQPFAAEVLERADADALVVDLWNSTGRGRVVYRVEEERE